MQVILIKDLDTLGSTNEIVNVKPGYARNYLIPQKFAIEASRSNMGLAEQKAKQQAKKENELLKEIAKVAEVLKDSPIKVGAKSGTSGKIFGSVTSIQIARAIKEQKGYEIDRKRISITEEVKDLGTYKATIDFGNNNIVDLEFEVIAE
jgi:large subunit ribosomal protein L9